MSKIAIDRRFHPRMDGGLRSFVSDIAVQIGKTVALRRTHVVRWMWPIACSHADRKGPNPIVRVQPGACDSNTSIRLLKAGGICLTQEYIIHTAALGAALDIALKRVAELSGDDARLNFESVRDEAIDLFKNFDIPPEPDMGRIIIVGPAIEMLRELFEHSLESLNKSQMTPGAGSVAPRPHAQDIPSVAARTNA
jgi:hypothetical protein